MAKTLLTGRGVAIQIGRELGNGAEGSVYEVEMRSNQAAKLYHKVPDSRKQAKLAFMSATVDAQLLDYAAWPQDTLHDKKNGPAVGFLMPKATGRVPIHMLYSPAHRRQDYPKVAWDFLLFAARNTAQAFATLHNHRHVFGDVNERNVMVGMDSKVMLIDCDSFQINVNGEMHLCGGAVGHFTPPELQGLASFDGITRTFNHDDFGLALLIFHTLFGGRHPYSGVPLRNDVAEALESDIKAFRFAYARDAQSRAIAPPPTSIPLSLVTDEVAVMFESAFTEQGTSRGRPSAQQWVTVLDAMRRRLKKCSSASMHIYPDHVGNCPWCALEDKGVVYFAHIGSGFTSAATGFALGNAWIAIEAVFAPAPLIIPNIATISVTAEPLPPGVGGKRQIYFLRFLVVCSVACLLAVAPGAWFVIAIGAWIAWSMVKSVGKSGRDAERSKRRTALDEARKEYETLETRIRKESGPEGFAEKKQELARLRNEYQTLPAVEKSEIEKLHATAEARQKRQFLDRCFIDSATISGVGLAKKAALRSFGIETAADVDQRRVRSVRGFGDVLTRAVVDWKKSCERRFIFNPGNAVSETDKNGVRAKIAARKRLIEVALSSGASDLQRFRQEANAKSTALYPLLNSAAKTLAQVQADLTLI